MEYSQDDYLMISGIQHFKFCRRRKPIVFTDELRDEVKKIFGEMHDYYDRNYTPKVKTSKRCVSCSLKDICMPKIDKSGSVKSYINKMLGETL